IRQIAWVPLGLATQLRLAFSMFFFPHPAFTPQRRGIFKRALRARLKIARYGQEATVPSPFCTEIKQARCLNLAFSALSSLFSLASGNFQTGS
ncbi:hypothetical protein ACI2S8_17510, partial [Ralstonia nicotianae]